VVDVLVDDTVVRLGEVEYENLVMTNPYWYGLVALPPVAPTLKTAGAGAGAAETRGTTARSERSAEDSMLSVVQL